MGFRLSYGGFLRGGGGGFVWDRGAKKEDIWGVVPFCGWRRGGGFVSVPGGGAGGRPRGTGSVFGVRKILVLGLPSSLCLRSQPFSRCVFIIVLN